MTNKKTTAEPAMSGCSVDLGRRVEALQIANQKNSELDCLDQAVRTLRLAMHGCAERSTNVSLEMFLLFFVREMEELRERAAGRVLDPEQGSPELFLAKNRLELIQRFLLFCGTEDDPGVSKPN